MNPDDPRGATILEELSLVTQLRRAVKFAREPAIVQLMTSLLVKWLFEMAILKRADPRRAENCKRDNGAAGLPKENNRR